MQTALRLHTLPFNSIKTYSTALLFILGNMILPQLFHLVPQGGITWLPIYFFTLIGAYKYGWRVGLLTALVSPIANALLFGMPSVAGLPAIILKSVLLAAFAGYAAYHFKKVSLAVLAAVILSYQFVGTLGEWLIKGDFFIACQDFRIGIPGMLLQLFGARAIIIISQSGEDRG
ncbi:MAG: ECF transporter S component [Paramuribaculum sp.]|nr:ECF transporter S component [Paramuribaculum sp.]